MATSGHIENLTPKKTVLETGIISLFLFILAHRAHFWHHLCILTGLNVKTQDGRHLSFPLFSYLSHSIHCSCWMSHQKLISSNICWFYVLPLHIFPQWSPRKVEINNFLNRKSIISSSIPLHWCHKMNCNDNDWCCKFINLYVYYGYVNVSFWLIC